MAIGRRFNIRRPCFGRAKSLLNRPLAEKLAVKPGDEIILRLPRPGQIPADSALGQKHDTVQNFRLAVSGIIPAEGLGRFGLRPTQQEPLNAYISLAWLQDRLEQPGLANAIFIELQNDGQSASSATGSKAQNLLHPKLADLGLEIEKTPLGYINITSKRMILEPGAEKEILKTLNGKSAQGLVVSSPPLPIWPTPSPINLRAALARAKSLIPRSPPSTSPASRRWGRFYPAKAKHCRR